VCVCRGEGADQRVSHGVRDTREGRTENIFFHSSFALSPSPLASPFPLCNPAILPFHPSHFMATRTHARKTDLPGEQRDEDASHHAELSLEKRLLLRGGHVPVCVRACVCVCVDIYIYICVCVCVLMCVCE
jgi:hypothetical protein